MIRGIGTDIIEISRVAHAVERDAFLERVYTSAEIAYCKACGKQAASSYAVRFAGKEAVLKAFGTGLRGGSLQEIEILPDDLGKPCVHLSGFFAEWFEAQGGGFLQLSLSHAREHATAFCIWEGFYATDNSSGDA